MDWQGTFDFRMPSHIVFGLNSAQRVGEIAVGLGSKAPLLMTDPVLYNLGLTQGVERALHEADLRLEVFAEVVTEPTLVSVESAVETFRSRGCDLLVALGGGSAIDSAKHTGAYGVLPCRRSWIPGTRYRICTKSSNTPRPS